MTDAPQLKGYCSICGKKAYLINGLELYKLKTHNVLKKKLYAAKLFWKCDSCDAWVGCHQGTDDPLGTFATSELRRLRQQAHSTFDPLWKAKMIRDNVSQTEARKAGYAWLAKALNLTPEQCHIGRMNREGCKRVIELCSRYTTHLEKDRGTQSEI